MLFEYLFATGMSVSEKIMGIVFNVVAVIFVITAHEFAHGLAAYLLGDDTAKLDGRLSFNPLRHMNPVGFLMLLLFGFGWANPVPIRASKFKHPRAGTIITAAAGPFTNFLIGFIGIMLYGVCTLSSKMSGPMQNLALFFYVMSYISVGLGIFNLIPLPPLDGSKIVGELLPYNLRYKYYSIEKYSMIIFLVIIVLSSRLNFIGVAVGGVINFFLGIASAILL